MEETILGMQIGMMRSYYKYFSKYARGKKTPGKVAWVTSFAPVEILEALGIQYYYPESYSAVIASSNMEQDMLKGSEKENLSCDCCSYACCMEGCISTGEGPRGTLPVPDILIASNNQCNTLPGWWNILAERYNVPLFVIDYPGEDVDRATALSYVTRQHKELIKELEKLTGNKLEESILNECINRSVNSISSWEKIVKLASRKEINYSNIFDDIFFLITMRSKSEAEELYANMAEDLAKELDKDDSGIPLFMVGYPLWYSPERYFANLLEGFRICGSNYITWWILDYSGADAYERLFNAYNYTFLNLKQETRNKRLSKAIDESEAVAAITLRNKSCKCDFVSAKNIRIPQAEVEIDMVDRNYMDEERAKQSINILKDLLREARN